MNWMKSKTLWFAFALAIFGVLEMNIKVFQTYLSPDFFGFFTIIVSVIVALLRVITTLPLAEK